MVVTSLMSGYVFFENQRLRNNNEVEREQYNMRVAFLTNGLRNNAKKLEDAYLSSMAKQARYVEFNKQKPCGMPVDLATLDPQITYVPAEALYINMGEPAQ